jgi:hypothetical protein
MADTFLGLVMEISADPSKAADALQAFEESTGKSFERAAAGTKPLDASLLTNRESVRLLGEELGFRMPRAVSGALAEMLPGINAIGPALLGAFAIAEIPKFIEEVKDAATALGGYTKAVRDAEKADIDASTSALIHFTTIAQGTLLIAQTNRALADLAAKQGNWKEEAKAASEAQAGVKASFLGLLGPVGEAINLYRGYKAAVKEGSDTESQSAQLRERLGEQLDQMTKLREAQRKEAARIAKEREEAEKRSAETLADWIARKQREIQKWAEEAPKAVRELTAGAKAYDAALAASHQHEIEHNLFLEKMARDEMALLPLQQRSIDLARQEIQVLTVDDTTTRHLSAAYSEYLLVKQDAMNVSRAFTQAIRDEVAAVNEDMLGGVKNLSEGFVSLIGGQKAAAVFKAGYEVAEGIAALAEGTWPPNPAALVAAGLHFEAAAQYAMMGGGGGGRRGGGGGTSGGSYSPGRAPEYSGGGGSGWGVPPQTLAPGAGGADGRYGVPGSGIVMVFGGSDVHAWVAKTVTEAANRGHTVIATSSQRGAPVGH